MTIEPLRLLHQPTCLFMYTIACTFILLYFVYVFHFPFLKSVLLLPSRVARVHADHAQQIEKIVTKSGHVVVYTFDGSAWVSDFCGFSNKKTIRKMQSALSLPPKKLPSRSSSSRGAFPHPPERLAFWTTATTYQSYLCMPPPFIVSPFPSFVTFCALFSFVF